jgi:putative endonuclease
VTEKRPCVYILASQRNGTLYVGVTSDLARRIWQHRSESVDSFVQKYRVFRLVFAEFHETMDAAIRREKQIKKWRRAWKLEMIERQNPQWQDLYDDLALSTRLWVPAFAGTTRKQGGGRCVLGFSITSTMAACRWVSSSKNGFG